MLAADLASGVEWCAHAGHHPTAGGEHPLMGTHNRIFNVSSPAHPRAYLEIIAINPGAPRPIPTSARRWFDMDDANLQAQVAARPQLIHWVASVPDVAAACTTRCRRWTWIAAPSSPPAAHAHGLLQWQITVRDDGLRLMDGCLPPSSSGAPCTPATACPPAACGTTRTAAPAAATLQAACDALGVGPRSPSAAGNAPGLSAQLATPLGPVTLSPSTEKKAAA